MDHRLKSSSSHAKSSKILALAALLVALYLPYYLVKTFRPEANAPANPINEQKNAITHIVLPLPDSKKTPSKEPLQAQQEEGQWKIIMTQPGDSLAGVFKKAGLDKKTLQLILKENPNQKALVSIQPNQKLQLFIRQNYLEKFIFSLNTTQSVVSTLENGQYKHQISSRKMTSHNHYVTATVHGSLYATAKRYHISYKLIQQMANIFNWEIDFSRDVREGDQFTIIYQAYFVENEKVGTGDIIAVSYTNKGKPHRAIRHALREGESYYYTPEGQSLQKAFMRYPVKFSHISSTFSLSRYHPILKRVRPHKGIDLAAPIGTPIRAVGDGIITSIGKNNGYGNLIKIRHNKQYTTLYAHMLKFRRGLGRGDRVKKGDVIGYVGQTGLASGPHCHFEFHINKSPKNPTTISLPRSSSIPQREMASFSNHANAMFAQIKLFEDAYLTTQTA